MSSASDSGSATIRIHGAPQPAIEIIFQVFSNSNHRLASSFGMLTIAIHFYYHNLTVEATLIHSKGWKCNWSLKLNNGTSFGNFESFSKPGEPNPSNIVSIISIPITLSDFKSSQFTISVAVEKKKLIGKAVLIFEFPVDFHHFESLVAPTIKEQTDPNFKLEIELSEELQIVFSYSVFSPSLLYNQLQSSDPQTVQNALRCLCHLSTHVTATSRFYEYLQNDTLLTILLKVSNQLLNASSGISSSGKSTKYHKFESSDNREMGELLEDTWKSIINMKHLSRISSLKKDLPLQLLSCLGDTVEKVLSGDLASKTKLCGTIRPFFDTNTAAPLLVSFCELFDGCCNFVLDQLKLHEQKSSGGSSTDQDTVTVPHGHHNDELETELTLPKKSTKKGSKSKKEGNQKHTHEVPPWQSEDNWSSWFEESCQFIAKIIQFILYFDPKYIPFIVDKTDTLQIVSKLLHETSLPSYLTTQVLALVKHFGSQFDAKLETVGLLETVKTLATTASNTQISIAASQVAGMSETLKEGYDPFPNMIKVFLSEKDAVRQLMAFQGFIQAFLSSHQSKHIKLNHLLSLVEAAPENVLPPPSTLLELVKDMNLSYEEFSQTKILKVASTLTQERSGKSSTNEIALQYMTLWMDKFPNEYFPKPIHLDPKLHVLACQLSVNDITDKWSEEDLDHFRISKEQRKKLNEQNPWLLEADFYGTCLKTGTWPSHATVLRHALYRMWIQPELVDAVEEKFDFLDELIRNLLNDYFSTMLTSEPDSQSCNDLPVHLEIIALLYGIIARRSTHVNKDGRLEFNQDPSSTEKEYSLYYASTFRWNAVSLVTALERLLLPSDRKLSHLVKPISFLVDKTDNAFKWTLSPYLPFDLIMQIQGTQRLLMDLLRDRILSSPVWSKTIGYKKLRKKKKKNTKISFLTELKKMKAQMHNVEPSAAYELLSQIRSQVESQWNDNDDDDIELYEHAFIRDTDKEVMEDVDADDEGSYLPANHPSQQQLPVLPKKDIKPGNYDENDGDDGDDDEIFDNYDENEELKTCTKPETWIPCARIVAVILHSVPYITMMFPRISAQFMAQLILYPTPQYCRQRFIAEIVVKWCQEMAYFISIRPPLSVPHPNVAQMVRNIISATLVLYPGTTPNCSRIEKAAIITVLDLLFRQTQHVPVRAAIGARLQFASLIKRAFGLVRSQLFKDFYGNLTAGLMHAFPLQAVTQSNFNSNNVDSEKTSSSSNQYPLPPSTTQSSASKNPALFGWKAPGPNLPNAPIYSINKEFPWSVVNVAPSVVLESERTMICPPDVILEAAASSLENAVESLAPSRSPSADMVVKAVEAATNFLRIIPLVSLSIIRDSKLSKCVPSSIHKGFKIFRQCVTNTFDDLQAAFGSEDDTEKQLWAKLEQLSKLAKYFYMPQYMSWSSHIPTLLIDLLALFSFKPVQPSGAAPESLAMYSEMVLDCLLSLPFCQLSQNTIHKVVLPLSYRGRNLLSLCLISLITYGATPSLVNKASVYYSHWCLFNLNPNGDLNKLEIPKFMKEHAFIPQFIRFPKAAQLVYLSLLKYFPNSKKVSMDRFVLTATELVYRFAKMMKQLQDDPHKFLKMNDDACKDVSDFYLMIGAGGHPSIRSLRYSPFGIKYPCIFKSYPILMADPSLNPSKHNEPQQHPEQPVRNIASLKRRASDTGLSHLRKGDIIFQLDKAVERKKQEKTDRPSNVLSSPTGDVNSFLTASFPSFSLDQKWRDGSPIVLDDIGAFSKTMGQHKTVFFPKIPSVSTDYGIWTLNPANMKKEVPLRLKYDGIEGVYFDGIGLVGKLDPALVGLYPREIVFGRYIDSLLANQEYESLNGADLDKVHEQLINSHFPELKEYSKFDIARNLLSEWIFFKSDIMNDDSNNKNHLELSSISMKECDILPIISNALVNYDAIQSPATQLDLAMPIRKQSRATSELPTKPTIESSVEIESSGSSSTSNSSSEQHSDERDYPRALRRRAERRLSDELYALPSRKSSEIQKQQQQQQRSSSSSATDPPSSPISNIFFDMPLWTTSSFTTQRKIIHQVSAEVSHYTDPFSEDHVKIVVECCTSELMNALETLLDFLYFAIPLANAPNWDCIPQLESFDWVSHETLAHLDKPMIELSGVCNIFGFLHKEPSSEIFLWNSKRYPFQSFVPTSLYWRLLGVLAQAERILPYSVRVLAQKWTYAIMKFDAENGFSTLYKASRPAFTAISVFGPQSSFLSINEFAPNLTGVSSGKQKDSTGKMFDFGDIISFRSNPTVISKTKQFNSGNNVTNPPKGRKKKGNGVSQLYPAGPADSVVLADFYNGNYEYLMEGNENSKGESRSKAARSRTNNNNGATSSMTSHEDAGTSIANSGIEAQLSMSTEGDLPEDIEMPISKHIKLVNSRLCGGASLDSTAPTPMYIRVYLPLLLQEIETSLSAVLYSGLPQNSPALQILSFDLISLLYALNLMVKEHPNDCFEIIHVIADLTYSVGTNSKETIFILLDILTTLINSQTKALLLFHPQYESIESVSELIQIHSVVDDRTKKENNFKRIIPWTRTRIAGLVSSVLSSSSHLPRFPFVTRLIALTGDRFWECFGPENLFWKTAFSCFKLDNAKNLVALGFCLPIIPYLFSQGDPYGLKGAITQHPAFTCSESFITLAALSTCYDFGLPTVYDIKQSYCINLSRNSTPIEWAGAIQVLADQILKGDSYISNLPEFKDQYAQNRFYKSYLSEYVPESTVFSCRSYDETAFFEVALSLLVPLMDQYEVTVGLANKEWLEQLSALIYVDFRNNDPQTWATTILELIQEGKAIPAEKIPFKSIGHVLHLPPYKPSASMNIKHVKSTKYMSHYAVVTDKIVTVWMENSPIKLKRSTSSNSDSSSPLSPPLKLTKKSSMKKPEESTEGKSAIISALTSFASSRASESSKFNKKQDSSSYGTEKMDCMEMIVGTPLERTQFEFWIPAVDQMYRSEISGPNHFRIGFASKKAIQTLSKNFHLMVGDVEESWAFDDAFSLILQEGSLYSDPIAWRHKHSYNIRSYISRPDLFRLDFEPFTNSFSLYNAFNFNKTNQLSTQTYGHRVTINLPQDRDLELYPCISFASPKRFSIIPVGSDPLKSI